MTSGEPALKTTVTNTSQSRATMKPFQQKLTMIDTEALVDDSDSDHTYYYTSSTSERRKTMTLAHKHNIPDLKEEFYHKYIIIYSIIYSRFVVH